MNGKTVNRRLSQGDADLYREWIANNRRLGAIVKDMREIARRATELILTGAADPTSEV